MNHRAGRYAFIAVAILLAVPVGIAIAQTESTDVYIRRLAGLSAPSTKGDIQIVDVGHLPMSTMISIVASYSPTGWHVSYACAQSPGCTPAHSFSQDHIAKEYDLSPETGRHIETIINRLANEPEQESLTGNNPTCGHLAVSISFKGFKRDYRQACVWGATLAELEDILKPQE